MCKMQDTKHNPAKHDFLIGIIAVNYVFARQFLKNSIFFTSNLTKNTQCYIKVFSYEYIELNLLQT